MSFLKNIAASILFAATMASPLAAQEKPISLSGDVTLEKTVVDDAGETTVERVAPDTIVPGDRLIFGTDYRNAGAEPVEDFVITNPLPGAVMLAADADPALVVSVDGGTTWGTLAELSVTDDDGNSRAAEHADVTHIRWTLAVVAPGESGRLEFPAIIR